MFKEWKRKQKIRKKLHEKQFNLCKGRFLITCEGCKSYSVYDTQEDKWIDDMRWIGFDMASAFWNDKKNEAYNCPSEKEAKDTVNFIVWMLADKRFCRIIDSYHRVKNKPISYT